MSKIAVIDIGSNSVRLMLMSNGKTLYKRINTTRLGEGICRSSLLCEAAVLRTAKAVGDFYALSKKEGCEKIAAFATAAVRSAKNADEFLSAVRKVCPLSVDVISGEDEAEIGLLGAVGNADGGILDVGGASSELTFCRDGKIEYSRSVDVGAVRLFDMCGRSEEKLSAYIDGAIGGYGDVSVPVPLFGVGGTATSLAAVKLRLKEYSPSAVEGTEITPSEAEKIAKELLLSDVGDIVRAYPAVPYARAEILGGGAALVAKIMKKVGAEKLIVSERDNLEGYALSRGMI